MEKRRGKREISTYDDKGNQLSFRNTNGRGWEVTYDEKGNETSYRETDNKN